MAFQWFLPCRCVRKGILPATCCAVVEYVRESPAHARPSQMIDQAESRRSIQLLAWDREKGWSGAGAHGRRGTGSYPAALRTHHRAVSEVFPCGAADSLEESV